MAQLTNYDVDTIHAIAQISGFNVDMFFRDLLIVNQWAAAGGLLETITQADVDAVFGAGVIDVNRLKDVAYWICNTLTPALEANGNDLIAKMNHVRRAV